MKGSSTLLFIGLGSALLLAYAWKRNGGSSRGSMTQTPERAATGGTTKATAPATKPKKTDPLKALTETAKTEATKAGQKAIIDWFAGNSGAP